MLYCFSFLVLFVYLWAQSMFIDCHDYKNARVETWVHSSNYPIYLVFTLARISTFFKMRLLFFHSASWEDNGNYLFTWTIQRTPYLPQDWPIRVICRSNSLLTDFCHNYSCRLVHFLSLCVPHSSTDLSVFWDLVKLNKGSIHWRSGKESKATTVYDIWVHTTASSDSGGQFLE